MSDVEQRAAFEALLEKINWLGYSIAAPAFRQGRAKEVIAALRAAQAQRAPDELRRTVKAMVTMLEAREWAEHVSQDPDAMALESCITDLHNDLAASPQSETPK